MNGEPRSIQKELTLLRPFLDRVVSGSWPRYSEEEVREAEKRLGVPLPAPVRELYLLASDLLTGSQLLTPLELLHWEQDCLGFYEAPDDGCALGIRRGGEPNQLYRWELHDPEEESYDYWDEFAELCEEDDRKGRRKLAKKCHSYWKKINARYPELPADPKRLEYKTQYNCALDAYGLFLALDALYEACEDYQREHPEESLLWAAEDCPLEEEKEGDLITERYFQRLHRQITRLFPPLTADPQLLALEAPGLQMAYLDQRAGALLLAWDWDRTLNLLVTGEPDPAFLRECRELTGLDFRRCKL